MGGVVIKGLVILLLIWYGLKILFRLLFPVFIARFIRKTQESFNEHYKYQQSKEKEGSVTVDSKNEKKEYKKDIGECVDFEDVEE